MGVREGTHEEPYPEGGCRINVGRGAVFKDQRMAWYSAGVPWGARPGRSEGMRDQLWLCLSASDPEEVGSQAALVQGAVRTLEVLGWLVEKLTHRPAGFPKVTRLGEGEAGGGRGSEPVISCLSEAAQRAWGWGGWRPSPNGC